MYIVRKATESDVDQIVELGKCLWLELKYDGVVQYDDESVSRTCHNLIDEHVLLVATTDEDEVVGYLGAVVGDVFFNTAVSNLSEVFWWVESNWRKKGVGRDLLIAMQDAAIENNCKFVSSMLNHHAADGKAGEMMVEMGFKAFEKTYIKEVPYGGV